MACVPPVRVEVVKVLRPWVERGPAAWSSVKPPPQFAPSPNFTCPVVTAAPLLAKVTLAVKVTDCPKLDGLGAEVRTVVVLSASVQVVTATPDTAPVAV